MREVDATVGYLLQQIGWLPDWVAGIVAILVAAGLALVFHHLLMRLLTRASDWRGVYLQQLLPRIRGPARMAMIIFAISLVLNATPFPPPVVAGIRHALLVAFIALIGWTALTALGIASAVYLQRYRLDVEDNLLARKHVTQTRLLRRTFAVLIGIVTISAALMTFDDVRQYGVSLLASAGAAALIVGLAMQPVLSNLIAGIQIAVTQPIRIDDAVVVENEWGWVEEITATYVVIRLWDWRRLVLPLSYFIERPFQNWTCEKAAIIGTVFLHVDYTAPVDVLREKLTEIVAASPLWDGQVVNLQVTEARERTMEIRLLVSARNSPTAWDLRCAVREKMIAFLQEAHPGALPRHRADVSLARPGPGAPHPQSPRS